MQVGGSVLNFGGDILIMQDAESGEIYNGVSASYTPLSFIPEIPVEMHTEVLQYTVFSESYNIWTELLKLLRTVEGW